MNVKIDEKSVTFKISEQEMHTLLLGRVLKTFTPISPTGLALVIEPCLTEPCSTEPHEGFEYAPLQLVVDKEGSCLKFLPTRNQLLQLETMGRNKKGVSVIVNGLEVSLQVDVRADSRSRPTDSRHNKE